MPAFAHNAQRLGVVGTEIGKQVARTIRALQRAGSLPGPDDVMTLLPQEERGVSTLAHVRRIRGRNLWIWYTATDAELWLHALTNAPPS